MNIDVDVDGARELADELMDVPRELLPKVRKVVERGALNIKNQMRDEAKANGHYKHFHRSIDYDMLGDLEAEIGPNKNRVQGALGNLLYFGRSDTAPVLDINSGLNRESPRFQLALADVAEDVL